MDKPRCANDDEFDLLMRMADDECRIMGHDHHGRGRRYHCASGLVEAEKRWDAGDRSVR